MFRCHKPYVFAGVCCGNSLSSALSGYLHSARGFVCPRRPMAAQPCRRASLKLARPGSQGFFGVASLSADFHTPRTQIQFCMWKPGLHHYPIYGMIVRAFLSRQGPFRFDFFEPVFPYHALTVADVHRKRAQCAPVALTLTGVPAAAPVAGGSTSKPRDFYVATWGHSRGHTQHLASGLTLSMTHGEVQHLTDASSRARVQTSYHRIGIRTSDQVPPF